MKTLIIEDEPLAAERLEELIINCDPAIEVIGSCDSVKRSVKWFMENPMPDLLFLDIQLGDGLSFEIFDQVDVDCPVIFTTAFDAYAIEAFKLNSIGYLLKPVKPDELKSVIEKYKASPYFIDNTYSSQQQIALDQVRLLLTREYKKRFLVKTGLHIRSIPVEEILYIYSMEKATYALISGGKSVLFDHTLEQLEKLLNPLLFFRINRKYIVSFDAITDMVTFSHYKLKIKLQNCSDEDVFISRDRMQDFKEWLDR
ncbi:MAG TPA: LytTR family DNA-binding domain-containing protein [Bacteroidales bacterium]|nr:LytTR family DNA-binding domain-containing protein [Bacteroidales bacterium]